MKAATYLLVLAASVNVAISNLNITFDPNVYSATHLDDLHITVEARLELPIFAIQYTYRDLEILSHGLDQPAPVSHLTELVVHAGNFEVNSTSQYFEIVVNRCAADSNKSIVIDAVVYDIFLVEQYATTKATIEDVPGIQSITVNEEDEACDSTIEVQTSTATIGCKISVAYPEPTMAIFDGDSNIISTHKTDSHKCLYNHTSTSKKIQLKNGEKRTITCMYGPNESCNVTLIKVLADDTTTVSTVSTGDTTLATSVTSPNSGATDNTVIIGGASGAAGLLIIIIIIVVVCIKIKRDKAEKNNNSMELPYATHTAITKDNSSIPVEYATVGEGNGSVGHDNGKAGHENGTVGHDNANFENPPEGPYSNIKPAQQPIDDSVVYAQPEKRPRKQRPSKSKKRAPGEEEISYANLDDKLTDHQKGQFKSPEGIIYTEVAHNETPKDGVQRRENNGPTDYAQVDFARTPQNNPIMPPSDDVYSEVGEASGGDRGPIHPRRGDTPPPLPMGKPPQKPPRM